MKRLTALILAILMLVQLCPSVSFAADNSSDSQHEVLSEQLGKPVYHAVTFLAGGEEVSAVFVADGTAIDELPTAPARSGEAFIGWYEGDAAFTAGTVITGDRTVEAVYTAVDTELEAKKQGSSYQYHHTGVYGDVEIFGTHKKNQAPSAGYDAAALAGADGDAWSVSNIKNNTELTATAVVIALPETGTLSAYTVKNHRLDTLLAENLAIGSRVTVDLSMKGADGLALVAEPENVGEEAEVEGALYANDDLYITGKIPGNGVIEVIPATAEIDGEKLIAAYDVNIYANAKQQKKSRTWQPAGKKVQVHWRDDAFVGEINVYHMDGAKAEYVDTVEAQDGWVVFEAESFSVYAFTQSIEKTVTIGGSTYRITVTYDNKAGIPDGAEIDAREIPVDGDYLTYLTETAETLGVELSSFTYNKLLDIAIVYGGKEIEPKTPVDVKVELLDADRVTDLRVVHFENNTKPVELSATTEKSAVTFTTDGFSLFSLSDFSLTSRIVSAIFGERKLYENDNIVLTGHMPLLGTVEANPVDVQIAGQNVLVAYDIKIYANPIMKILGITWQPSGDAVTVTVKSSALEDGKVLSVYHMQDASSEPEFVAEVEAHDSAVSFDANAFSIYPITDNNKRLQYNFYDGTSLLASEYIRKENNQLQTLYDPGVEPEYGQTFVGWAYAANESDTANIYTIEQLNAQAASTYNSATEELTVINVYAIYDEAWYLRYMDQDEHGDATVLKVVRVRKDAANKNVTIDYTYTPEEGIVFEGWMDVATGRTYQQGQTLTLDHHIDLYLKIQGRYWLVFDSNKGTGNSSATYTAPQLLIGDDVTVRPEDPVRKGYTFGGWYTNPNGTGAQYTFGRKLTSDVTVYAKWTADETDYHVIYWKQSAGDSVGLADSAKHYEYAGSAKRSALTDSTVQLTNADRNKGGTANSEYGYYFTYNANNSDTAGKVVNADGTTTLNVYYDRREITYNFTSSTNFTVPSYTGVVDGQTVVLTPDGNGGYTYPKTTIETIDLPYTGTRYSVSTTNNNNPQHYRFNDGVMQPIYYLYYDGIGTWNDGYYWFTQNNASYWYRIDNSNFTRYIQNTNGTIGVQDNQLISLNPDGTYPVTTTTTTAEPYTGEVNITSRQTKNATFTGLYGAPFSHWPNPGNNRVWTITYNGRTLSLPMALTLFDPQAALDPAATQTTVNFTASNYGTGYMMTVYKQTEEGLWVYEEPYILTTANLGSGGTWYPTETFEGFTVHSYQTGSVINPNGNWTPTSATGSFSYNNDVFLRYSRNQHNLRFISQGSNVEERTENIISGIYYESDLSKYAEGGSEYYEPTNGIDGYYFAGWYADADGQVPFDFNITMPDNDITVYAKWDTYRVRVVLVPTPNNAHNDEVELANNQALSFRLDYNETVKDANIGTTVAKRPGYKLIGWYYSPDFDPSTEVYFDLQVNKDTAGVNMDYQHSADWDKYGDNDGAHENVRGILKLYAKWELNVDENSVYVEYDVDDVYRTYDTAGMLQTTIPVDAEKYALTNSNVTFQVAEAPTNYANGFEFDRWVLLNPDGSESSQVFNPGGMANEIPSSFIYEETIIDDLGNTTTIKKLRLKARFNIEAEKVTTVTYDGNGGVTNDSAALSSVTESYPVNKDFYIKDADSFVREGYKLVGWSFNEDTTFIEFSQEVARLNEEQLAQMGYYTLGEHVAADNLEFSEHNNWDPLQNTIYAIWQPVLPINVYIYEKGAWQSVTDADRIASTLCDAVLYNAQNVHWWAAGLGFYSEGTFHATNPVMDVSTITVDDVLYKPYSYAFSKVDGTTITMIRFVRDDSNPSDYRYEYSNDGTTYSPFGTEELDIYYYKNPVPVPIYWYIEEDDGTLTPVNKTLYEGATSLYDQDYIAAEWLYKFHKDGSNIWVPAQLIRSEDRTDVYGRLVFGIGPENAPSDLTRADLTDTNADGYYLRNLPDGLTYATDMEMTNAQVKTELGLYVIYGRTRFTFTKQVSGGSGDRNQEFTITINAPAGYTVKKNNEAVTVINNQITIKHGDTVIISGLSQNATITLTEDDNSNNIYTKTWTKVSGDGDATVNGATLTVTLTQSTEYTLDNHLDPVAPTGYRSHVIPYLLMLLSGAALLLLRRRKGGDADA